MKIKKLLTLIALISGLVSMGQKYKLGDVTKEELLATSHPTEPSAGAAILFNKGQTSVVYSESNGFTLVTEVETKIKIYTKEGYGWANKIIPFYTASNGENETVSISKAVTYNLVDGSIEKTRLKGEGEFTEEVNKFWKQKKIVMPDVKEGSIIEYKYTINSPFIHVFPEWRFQETIPVNYSEYTTRIPEYFMFNPLFRGYHHPTTSTQSSQKSYNFTSKQRTGVTLTQTNFTKNQIDYSETATTYVIHNVPSMKVEQYAGNIHNYISSIEHELAMTKFPDSPSKSYSSTWEDVVKSIYDYDDFGPELQKTGYFEKDIDAILAGTTSPQEKAYTIFSYVKNRMNWNEYYGYGCDAGVKKAYNEKVGNSAEINLMLTSMLRYAGLDANPVLVSTRSNKISLFPSRTTFNYVIAAVNIDNGVVLFDATSKASMPNVLPVRALNWVGRLIRNDGTSVAVDLLPGANSKEIINISAQIDSEGNVTGKLRDQYYDYNAYAFRESYTGVSAESYIEKLEKTYTGLEIGEYKVNAEDMSKPVVEEYDFTHNGLADVIGDKIYISPLLFLAKTENPFKQEKREYPIDFVFPTQDKYMISLILPEGYVVESSPAPVSLAMEENLGSFKYNIIAKGNQVQVGMMLDLNYPLIPQDYYKTIQDFFQKMVEKESEKIVLKKV